MRRKGTDAPSLPCIAAGLPNISTNKPWRLATASRAALARYAPSCAVHKAAATRRPQTREPASQLATASPCVRCVQQAVWANGRGARTGRQYAPVAVLAQRGKLVHRAVWQLKLGGVGKHKLQKRMHLPPNLSPRAAAEPAQSLAERWSISYLLSGLGRARHVVVEAKELPGQHAQAVQGCARRRGVASQDNKRHFIRAHKLMPVPKRQRSAGRRARSRSIIPIFRGGRQGGQLLRQRCALLQLLQRNGHMPRRLQPVSAGSGSGSVREARGKHAHLSGRVLYGTVARRTLRQELGELRNVRVRRGLPKHGCQCVQLVGVQHTAATPREGGARCGLRQRQSSAEQGQGRTTVQHTASAAAAAHPSPSRSRRWRHTSSSRSGARSPARK